MAQVLLDPGTAQVESTLDTMFTELYGRTQLMTSSGTSAGFGGNASASTGSVTPKLWAQSATAAVALGAFHADGTNNLRVSLFADSINGYVGLDSDRTLGLIGYSFRIGGTERLRLDISGNLMLGVTSGAAQGITFQPSGASANAANINVCHISGTLTGATYMQFVYNSGVIGAIGQNGTTGVTYSTSSDYRLKDNVQPISGSGEFIDSLRPVTWAWKADGSAGAGFIAHELQAVSPSSVTGSKDAIDADGKPVYQAVEYGSAEVIAMLVAEVKSLRARVHALDGN